MKASKVSEKCRIIKISRYVLKYQCLKSWNDPVHEIWRKYRRSCDYEKYNNSGPG